MKKLWKLLKTIDDNLVKYLIYFYIFFIPLFPKFPFRTVSYTYIAIRIDDLFLVVLVAIFFLQVIRKKIQLRTNFFILFALFWLAIGLSLDWGLFVNKNLPYKLLAFYNTLRRFEYMIPFFIGLSVVKSEKDFFSYMKAIFIVFFIVCVYGIGQKFLGWPAVQTMNPEYARGHLLILTPEARISSTFAGHYDLAAYLVLMFPIVYSFYFFRKKITYLFLFILGLFALILTASRASYVAYIVSIFGLLILMKKPKYIAFTLVLTIVFTLLSSTLTSRIKRTFQMKQIFINEQTGQVVVPQKITVKEVPAGSFYVPFEGVTTTTNQTKINEKLVTEKLIDDIRWEASRSGKILTIDQAALIAATISAKLKPINTIVSDISFATRLQVEWPRAIAAFLTHPIFGTGPSSITEATDNDYLRWLGEFGLLGAGTFLFLLFSLAKSILGGLKKVRDNKKIIYYGFLFGLLAIMINASYIDVFEASKVAYIFWLVIGFYVASLVNYEKT